MPSHETTGQRLLRKSLNAAAAEMKKLREEDPAAYQAKIEAARARNPRGGKR